MLVNAQKSVEGSNSVIKNLMTDLKDSREDYNFVRRSQSFHDS